MKSFLLSIGAALLALCALPHVAHAQIENVPAAPDEGAIPVYPGDTVGAAGDEVWTKLGPMTVIRNVTRPIITPMLPAPDKATGAAVIVAPGGGMLFLAMPDEAVAAELNQRGIAVFLLKYRVVPTPVDIPGLMGVFAEMRERSKEGEVILPNLEGKADTQAAVALVRARSNEWGIDPAKVGLLGFSSGAQVARAAALSDAAEGRPDFVGLVYGAMDPVEVPETAPPMFAAIAMDDTTVPNIGFPVVEAWRKAGRPVELHAYQTGGHGFATGGPAATHRLYLDQFVGWLEMLGMVPTEQ